MNELTPKQERRTIDNILIDIENELVTINEVVSDLYRYVEPILIANEQKDSEKMPVPNVGRSPLGTRLGMTYNNLMDLRGRLVKLIELIDLTRE